ncbi:MAG: hypothetical protein LBH29_02715 [Elusimicrobiota bacterium]|nr:hypothetical protein [Elusimicrobiota bacterium]
MTTMANGEQGLRGAMCSRTPQMTPTIALCVCASVSFYPNRAAHLSLSELRTTQITPSLLLFAFV